MEDKDVKIKMSVCPECGNAIRVAVEHTMDTKSKNEFAKEGRVVIRPSGTEPIIRVMIEGKDKNYIAKKAEEIAKLIEEKLN